MHQLFHIYEEQNPEIETTFQEMTEDDINVMTSNSILVYLLKRIYTTQQETLS